MEHVTCCIWTTIVKTDLKLQCQYDAYAIKVMHTYLLDKQYQLQKLAAADTDIYIYSKYKVYIQISRSYVPLTDCKSEISNIQGDDARPSCSNSDLNFNRIQ